MNWSLRACTRARARVRECARACVRAHVCAHVSGYKLCLMSACRVSLQETRNLSNSLEKHAKLGIPHTLQESIWENTWKNKQKSSKMNFGKENEIITSVAIQKVNPQKPLWKQTKTKVGACPKQECKIPTLGMRVCGGNPYKTKQNQVIWRYIRVRPARRCWKKHRYHWITQQYNCRGTANVNERIHQNHWEDKQKLESHILSKRVSDAMCDSCPASGGEHWEPTLTMWGTCKPYMHSLKIP